MTDEQTNILRDTTDTAIPYQELPLRQQFDYLIMSIGYKFSKPMTDRQWAWLERERQKVRVLKGQAALDMADSQVREALALSHPADRRYNALFLMAAQIYQRRYEATKPGYEQFDTSFRG